MNWMKKGPELKLSELKVPDFLYDLFYDLKERHLLPLVALLIVAMVAAPIYFKGSTKTEPEASGPPVPATASTAAAKGGTIVVARSNPGLRDYRRRLKHYRALDPFEGPPEESEVSPEVTSATTSPPVAVPRETSAVGGEISGVAEVPVEPVGEPVAPSISPESAGIPVEPSSPGQIRTRYASNSVDVRIVSVPPHTTEQRKAKKREPKAQVRRNLPELTMLPARKTPAATFMGLSNDRKKGLFLISSDVESIFGEGKCLIGSQTCQLLALEPGLPETFVYGPQERTYRVELLKIHQTFAAHPRRAKLGGNKGKNRSQGTSGGTGNAQGPSAESTEASGPGGEPAERGNG